MELVLPFVPADGEAEIRAAFDRVLPLHHSSAEAWETAQLWFFETVVRIHRAAEGAPYTGLKPAGLSVVKQRLDALHELGTRRTQSLDDERRYVEAMLGLQVYSHHLYQAMIATDNHHTAQHAHPE